MRRFSPADAAAHRAARATRAARRRPTHAIPDLAARAGSPRTSRCADRSGIRRCTATRPRRPAPSPARRSCGLPQRDVRDRAPVSDTSSFGDRLNTACGWPAAARLSAEQVGVDQRDGFDEMTDRAHAADRIAGVVAHELRVRARPTAPTCAATFFSSTRFTPLATTSTGAPSDWRRNRIDFAICATEQPSRPRPRPRSCRFRRASRCLSHAALAGATRRAESGRIE